jgi:hypothetical protein
MLNATSTTTEIRAIAMATNIVRKNASNGNITLSSSNAQCTPTKRIINVEPNIAMGEISTMRRPHWLVFPRPSLHLGYCGWKA